MVFVDLATTYVLGERQNNRFNLHGTATTTNSGRSTHFACLSPKDECECEWYPFTHLTRWELDGKWVDLPDTHSPLPPRTDHGSISFEHSGDKRGVSAKTLGEVNAISTALKWALTDLSNVNRGRTLRLVLWTGDTRYHHLYPQVKIERIKRRGRKGYLPVE